MPEKDELDRLLDSALATYADPGANSGLEQRVLSTLDAERIAAPKPWRWIPWVIAIPLMASLLFWIGIAQFRHAPLQQQAIQSRPSPSSDGTPLTSDTKPPVDGATKGHDVRHAANATHAHRASVPEGRLFTTPEVKNYDPLPKLAVFPIPQPLTPQERALVAVAAQAPAPLREALVAAQEQDNAPVRIAAIHIPPIEPSTQTQP